MRRAGGAPAAAPAAAERGGGGARARLAAAREPGGGRCGGAAAAVRAAADGGGGGGGGGGAAGVPMSAGFNTVTWDLRYRQRDVVPGHDPVGRRRQRGRSAAPGIYQIRMTADGRTQTQPLRVRRNPLFKDVSDADLQAQFDLAIQIRDKTSEANNAVIRIRDLKTQVADRLTQIHRRAPEDGGRRSDGEPQRGRAGDLSGEEPERPGSAQLPDQGQQPAGVAAVDRHARRRPPDRQRAGDLQGPGRRS